MSMDVTFLGTGSAYPSPCRGASAIVFRTEGEGWLFDCGEGTQTQFMKSALKAGRITKIFITHLHGDHMFGLPGLLCTVSLQCGSTPTKQHVDIYGPVGLRSFIRMSLEVSHSQLVFPYTVHELLPSEDQCPAEEFRDFSRYTRDCCSLSSDEQIIAADPTDGTYCLLENEQFTVKAFKLYHRIPSFGFVIDEKDRPGKLDVNKLRELGVPPGPLYGKLKLGSAVTLENGQTISPCDVVGDPVPGRKVCILGDCSGVTASGAARLCQDADLLVHEATLDDSQMDKAKEHGHSTPKMAADFANLCSAKRLVLNHFSQRYKPPGLMSEGDEDVTILKTQAENVLIGHSVILAEDFLTINIPLQKLS
ncbi:zinc phosphodiesterase ELAC protein 1 isoform X1 [Hyla sarda]|uniref:zinc phosphodiesterase ELAC protein 1 isoform X1 n=2 Tax=Hyla sarda TaxID=327740 RepID=UPI0024C337AF|nr:zinc phosphodiesterase ELAC protein 1 isoform X1 [Hyla sarda]XP_056401133.1 zinc phosphodiesterase ELAC protein 1 isoform X1 [Hyla sarda]XP_056401143.1 zinc phosphodiesterase ELAC protein 1 isoform X1 [Hyla sarda]